MALLDDRETLDAFIEESLEHLDGIEDDLLAMEEAGAELDEDRVNKVFRAVHSIKGGAGFLGLQTVKDLAHGSENIIGKIRSRELIPDSAMISTLLDAIDTLSALINDPENANEANISTQLTALNAIEGGQPTATPPPQSKNENQAINDNVASGQPLFTIEKARLDKVLKEGRNLFILDYCPATDILAKQVTATQTINELKETGAILASNIDLFPESLENELSLSGCNLVLLFATIMEEDLLASFLDLPANQIQQMRTTDLTEGRYAVAAKQTPPAEPHTAPSQAPTAPPATQGQTPPSPAPTIKAANKTDSSLRVNVKLLDSLMTLAGELVLTRNQLVQAVSSRKAQGIDNISQRLDLVTSELQEAIMSTRMQPIGNVFNKFKRIVRDLSKSLAKNTELLITGEEVELDKTIIESIGDPLTHLVRNSVDHGLEMPNERQAAGKPAHGTLKLTAFHEGGHVMIAIEDDGAGIDLNKIKEKALTMGVHDSPTLEAMEPRDIAKLIFLPGMSTAKEVSDLSGRGVGMDVVHTNITKVGGTIDIDTTPGIGTRITIKLPLTLAIIPSLIVTVQNERFAIPQVNMVELVRIPAAKVKERIEKIGNALVMRLRGELLPLIRLADVLEIEERFFTDLHTGEHKKDRRANTADRRTLPDPVEEENQAVGAEERQNASDRRSNPMSAYNILVVSAGEYHYGLIVDQLLDSEEIVVKPLGAHLRDCNCYAGATVQGDGRVALILDIAGISHIMDMKTVSKAVHEHKAARAAKVAARSGKVKDLQSMLVVRNTPDEQMVIPLDLVSRIEKIQTTDIEITGGRKNIQYRGTSLPLFSVHEVAEVGAPSEESPDCYVIVFPVGGKEVGIIMSEIVDIVTADLQIDEMTHCQPGILGSTIIMEEITLLVDLYGVVTTIMPQWTSHEKSFRTEGSNSNILIVEDSRFFMNQLVSFVKEAGCRPLTANDGQQGLDVLASSQVDLILTDIEMPNMDGLDMTRAIRSDERFKTLPVIAVTSVAGEAAEKRGLAAGIDKYMVKLDREKIIETIHHYLR